MQPTVTPASTPLPARQTEGTAIASFVLMIVGWAGFGPFAWLPAIVCGHIGRSRIRREPSLGGDGFALAGLIGSYVGTALAFVVVVVLVLLLAFTFKHQVTPNVEPPPTEMPHIFLYAPAQH
jgi:uncharacterized protein DUF4190